jgi:hypothetical protein
VGEELHDRERLRRGLEEGVEVGVVEVDGCVATGPACARADARATGAALPPREARRRRRRERGGDAPTSPWIAACPDPSRGGGVLRDSGVRFLPSFLPAPSNWWEWDLAGWVLWLGAEGKLVVGVLRLRVRCSLTCGSYKDGSSAAAHLQRGEVEWV